MKQYADRRYTAYMSACPGFRLLISSDICQAELLDLTLFSALDTQGPQLLTGSAHKVGVCACFALYFAFAQAVAYDSYIMQIMI